MSKTFIDLNQTAFNQVSSLQSELLVSHSDTTVFHTIQEPAILSYYHTTHLSLLVYTSTVFPARDICSEKCQWIRQTLLTWQEVNRTVNVLVLPSLLLFDQLCLKWQNTDFFLLKKGMRMMMSMTTPTPSVWSWEEDLEGNVKGAEMPKSGG